MSHRPHRFAAQWQTLVERQSRSSESAAEFCRHHDLGYASFMQWRARLANSETSVSPSQPEVAHFIELTGGVDPLAATSARSDPAADNGSLLIELDLGDGLQLRISRGG